MSHKDTGNSKDALVVDMEKRLRAAIRKHKDLVLSFGIGEDTSRTEFVSQISQQMKELEEMGVTEVSASATNLSSDTQANKSAGAQGKKGKKDGKRSIELVAIDVPQAELHKIVLDIARRNKSAASFLKTNGQSLDESYPFKDNTFVKATHVTMAHCSRTKQVDMRSQYEALEGKTVAIKATGLLWSQRVAALSVDIAAEAEDGTAVPASVNEFTHITIWRSTGKVKAVESNKLPTQVESGAANKADLKEPMMLNGTLTFWLAGARG